MIDLFNRKRAAHEISVLGWSLSVVAVSTYILALAEAAEQCWCLVVGGRSDGIDWDTACKYLLLS